MPIIRININDREIETTFGKNILLVAEENGIDIPHLCYDKRMEAYGGCGLCVVEIEGIPKLQRACSTPAKNGMVIKTHTPKTIATRKTALNLLVSDHRGDCRPPCVLSCPAQTDCQGYVGLIANGQFKEAVTLIKEKLPLPASIGRICPHPCEDACRRKYVDKPISIAALKRFVGDIDLEDESYIPKIKEPSGKKIAIIGAGPAGISAAFFLAKEGHKVTIFEAMGAVGGMLRYGMPEYRLPNDIIDKEVELIKKMGVKIKINSRLGEDFTLESINKHYDAIFLAIGAWSGRKIGCKGDDMEGVLEGIDFLRDVSMNGNVRLGNKVVIVGGGNTAMDVARTAIRLGSKEVSVMYRRTKEEMPADVFEIEEAEEEGINFNFLLSPIEIIGDGQKVTGMKFQKMRLGDPDNSGRRKPEPVPGEEIFYEADTIISSTGQQVSIGNIEGIQVTSRGTILVNDETLETSIPGVFAGGDAVTGPLKAINAIAQGKNAAYTIDGYLNGNIKPIIEPVFIEQKDLTEGDFNDREKIDRAKPELLNPEFRRTNFHPTTKRLSEEEAIREASRCLECGCQDYFKCQLLDYVQEHNIDTGKMAGEKHNRNYKEDHPFIERNPDKCILCGLCVRACDEVMGVTAIGLVDRGFESIVAPEFGLPLKNSQCISCGQCIDVCPTGACIEKDPIPKQVPVELGKTNSICGFCGVGCNLILESRGSLVFRARPNKDIEEGILCAKGRFGIEHINSKERIIDPLIKMNDRFAKVDWELALHHMVKKLQSIRAVNGENSIALIASPRFTNEEFYVLRKLAQNLETNLVGSFAIDSNSGLEEVFGYNASTNSFEELKNTELILSIGMVSESHPIMGLKIKNSIEKDIKLISISSEQTRIEEWADVKYNPLNSLDFLKALIKALIEHGYVNESEISLKAIGYNELKESVKDAVITEEILDIAKMYGEAKRGIIVADEDTLTNEAIKLLGNIAVITGKIGQPYRGIILVRPKNNSQGAWDMGARTSAKDLLDLIDNGTVKAAVILGEDPIGIDKSIGDKLEKLEFLAVADMFMTDTAMKASTILPLVNIAETDGTFTRSDRKIQLVQSTIKPITGITNLEIILEITNSLGVGLKNIDDIRQKLTLEIPEYKGLIGVDIRKESAYWPSTVENPKGKQVLYSEGFNTEDNKAHLYIPIEGRAFRDRIVYDTIEKLFIEYMDSKGLKM